MGLFLQVLEKLETGTPAASGRTVLVEQHCYRIPTGAASIQSNRKQTGRSAGHTKLQAALEKEFSISPYRHQNHFTCSVYEFQGQVEINRGRARTEEESYCSFQHGHILMLCSRREQFLFHVWVSLFWETIKTPYLRSLTNQVLEYGNYGTSQIRQSPLSRQWNLTFSSHPLVPRGIKWSESGKTSPETGVIPPFSKYLLSTYCLSPRSKVLGKFLLIRHFQKWQAWNISHMVVVMFSLHLFLLRCSPFNTSGWIHFSLILSADLIKNQNTYSRGLE